MLPLISILRPYRARRHGCSVPRVETLGFYEADDFVKTRWKIVSFIFDSFWPTSDNVAARGNNNYLTCLALVLDLCGARASEHHKDQTPKSVTASSAQRNWLKRATE
jgi:hypothetical protein